MKFSIIFCLLLLELMYFLYSAADLPFPQPGETTVSPDATSSAPPDATDIPADAYGTKRCECAVFTSEMPAETDQPIITQSPLDVTCDAVGGENCLKLCSALARAAQESGPQLLCSALGHYKQLKASVHSRICGATNWTYTGLTSPTDICCHQNQVIACTELPDDQPLNQALNLGLVWATSWPF